VAKLKHRKTPIEQDSVEELQKHLQLVRDWLKNHPKGSQSDILLFGEQIQEIEAELNVRSTGVRPSTDDPWEDKRRQFNDMVDLLESDKGMSESNRWMFERSARILDAELSQQELVERLVTFDLDSFVADDRRATESPDNQWYIGERYKTMRAVEQIRREWNKVEKTIEELEVQTERPVPAAPRMDRDSSPDLLEEEKRFKKPGKKKPEVEPPPGLNMTIPQIKEAIADWESVLETWAGTSRESLDRYIAALRAEIAVLEHRKKTKK
jgi:hypothetical protein